jgi:hypothetical protein
VIRPGSRPAVSGACRTSCSATTRKSVARQSAISGKLSTNQRSACRAPYSNFGWAKANLARLILEARRKGDPEAKGMAPWRLHDFRRTGATGLQQLGFRLEVIEATLGHTAGPRAGVVGVYQRHRFAAEVRQALDAWGRHVETVVSG